MDLRQAKVGLTDVTDLNLRSIMRLYPYGSKKITGIELLSVRQQIFKNQLFL
jgi:hypothetical protein